MRETFLATFTALCMWSVLRGAMQFTAGAIIGWRAARGDRKAPR